MKNIGLTYTSEVKDATNTPAIRKLSDVTFLKRGFRYESSLDRFVAPIEMRTILELPYWRR